MAKQKRQLFILLAVLVIAVAAFVIVSRIPDEDEDAEESVSYEVTNLVQDDVIKLTFTNEYGTVTLAKEDDGWVCSDDHSINIDGDAVDTLVGKVAALTSENKIENVEDISQYGLDEPSLTILVSDGKTSYTLLVGDYNDTTYTYYMCLEDDTSTVYTTTSTTISSFNSYTVEDITAEEETTTVEETSSVEEETSSVEEASSEEETTTVVTE